MPWQYCNKQIEITDQTDHPCTLQNVNGGPLAANVFDFSPDEFHLAAAVCSHMHPVAPSAASPEALMIRSLVAQHVDDIRPDFAIDASADGFKDFVKSYFSGTVGTGLVYLAMIRSGYDWAGHFEHLKPAGTKGRTPDFVFSAQDKGTCLVESKGTRSASRGPFDVTVEEGYLKQVERHLGTILKNGARASHGYCVGAWMTSISKAELLVHHSVATISTGGNIPDDSHRTAPDDDPSLPLVQQQDVATAFSVVLGTPFGDALRNNRIENLPPLFKFSWLDRQWITARYPYAFRRWDANFSKWRFEMDLEWEGLHLYALEASIASSVLTHFWGGTEPGRSIEGLEPLNRELMYTARNSGEGAVLPNGLALVRRPSWFKGRFVRWNPDTRRFEG